MRWWPKRTRQERTDDTLAALSELAMSFGVLALGLLFILGGGYFAPDYDWMFIVGGLIALIGAYAVGQSLFGLLIEASIGMAGAMVVLIVVIIGFVLFQGYHLVMQ